MLTKKHSAGACHKAWCLRIGTRMLGFNLPVHSRSCFLSPGHLPTKCVSPSFTDKHFPSPTHNKSKTHHSTCKHHDLKTHIATSRAQHTHSLPRDMERESTTTSPPQEPALRGRRRTRKTQDAVRSVKKLLVLKKPWKKNSSHLSSVEQSSQSDSRRGVHPPQRPALEGLGNVRRVD